MKNNKLILAIFIITIIIEICVSIILLNYEKIDPNKVVSPSAERYRTSEVKEKKELIIKNPSELLKLDTNNISKANILHVINEYVTGVFPVAYSYNNATEEEIKKVYNDNITEYEKCGLYSYKDLYKIMDMVKEKNIDFNEYESIQFNDSKTNGNQVTISTSVMYKSGKFVTVNFIYINEFVEGIEIK